MNNTLQSPSSQVKKPFILSSFKEDSYSSFKNGIDAFLKLHSKLTVKIFKKVFNHRTRNGKRLSNAQIAYYAKCSIRTVKRATKKIHDAGLIYKDHPYARSMNQYYFHPMLVEGPTSHYLWFEGLEPQEKDIYLEHGKEGIATLRSNSVTLLSEEEYTMAKSLKDNWDYFPQSVRNGVGMASAYGSQRVSKFLNRNDEGFYCIIWPWGDKSVDKIEDIHPNDGRRICRDSFEPKSECSHCIGIIEGDKKISDPNVH